MPFTRWQSSITILETRHCALLPCSHPSSRCNHIHLSICLSICLPVCLSACNVCCYVYSSICIPGDAPVLAWGYRCIQQYKASHLSEGHTFPSVHYSSTDPRHTSLCWSSRAVLKPRAQELMRPRHLDRRTLESAALRGACVCLTSATALHSSSFHIFQPADALF